MKRIATISLIVYLLFATANPARGENNRRPAKEELSTKIGSIIKNTCVRKGKIGVKVFSLTKNESLYEYNADELMIPASVQKVITTATALNKLNADYSFPTSVVTDKKIEDDKITGNLYLIGYGDPKLVSERMWLMVKELVNLGIRSVEGDIIADETYFDEQRRVPSWPKKRQKAYDPSLGALSLNFNLANLYIEPSRAGLSPKVILDPQTKYFKITNKARTVKGRSNRLVVSHKISDGQHEIIIRGKIGEKDKLKYYYVNIYAPALYTANVFKDFLIKEGIKVKGGVKVGPVPEKNLNLIDFKSLPLGMLIRDINKRSNNFMAEQLLKTLGAEINEPPGTTEKGIGVVVDFLAEVGIPKGSYVIKDGSGYSRENRITNNQIVKVLSHTHRDFKTRAEFVSSLAIVGAETLKRYGKNNNAFRNVRVKTGTLDGVSSIAGFLDAKNGEEIAFSIIINNGCDPGTLRNIQIRMLLAMLEFSR